MKVLAVLLACAGCLVGEDGSDELDLAPAAAHPSTLGLHDGAINHCDNFESWHDGNGNLIFGQPGYPNTAATAAELGNSAWWTPLSVGTVRVSVPWDIALPSTSDAGLVTAHDPAMWSGYHLQALRNEQTCLDSWIADAVAAHETADIAFKPDYDYRDPATNHILVPEIATYRTAIAAFVARYPQVHIITPWGEPDYGNGHYPRSSNDRSPGCTAGCAGNALPAAGISKAKEVFFLPHGSSPMDPNRARFDEPSCSQERDDYCGPVLAAQMWMAVLHACPDCVLHSGAHAGMPGSGIVAGDFSGGGGLDGYLALYARHLNDCAGCAGQRPPTWAMHPYPDASNEEWCLLETGHDFHPAGQGGNNSVTERFVNTMDSIGYHEHTFVWLDEVSVFANDNYDHGSPTPPENTNGASCGVNHTANHPTYPPDVEGRAVKWLVNTLPRIRGTAHPGHEPIVDRVYYFRSFTGSDPNGDNITPTSPTPNQQALYDALVHR